jgi:hypothetical protein
VGEKEEEGQQEQELGSRQVDREARVKPPGEESQS